MQETGSKFLFDQTSQGPIKFDDGISLSPFSNRFPGTSFDIFASKGLPVHIDENTLLNKNYASTRTPNLFNEAK